MVYLTFGTSIWEIMGFSGKKWGLVGERGIYRNDRRYTLSWGHQRMRGQGTINMEILINPHTMVGCLYCVRGVWRQATCQYPTHIQTINIELNEGQFKRYAGAG